MTINTYMTSDHRVCDELFSEMENSAGSGNWEATQVVFGRFNKAMLHHFEMEEKVIFPEFNQCAGGGCNPTQVMLMEHEQMRRVLTQLSEALATKDKNRFLGLCENLMYLMQQHNMKEEQIMYNLCDQSLPSSSIISRLEAMKSA